MLEIQEGTGCDGGDCVYSRVKVTKQEEGSTRLMWSSLVLIKLDENGNDGNGVDNDGHGAGDNDWCSPSSSHT